MHFLRCLHKAQNLAGGEFMGKATSPAAYRQKANKELAVHGLVERVNGVDVNHGGSPVTRWRANKMLEPAHEAAIAYCTRIWDLIGISQSTTARYDEPSAKAHDAGDSGKRILSKMDADSDLARIKSYIPEPYWRVFENCVRFDEPTGVLGSRFTSPSKTEKTRAHTIVCFVGDIIAQRERLYS
jgi:hypothetical protein